MAAIEPPAIPLLPESVDSNPSWTNTSEEANLRSSNSVCALSSVGNVKERRSRIRKRRSICHAMNSSLQIAKGRDRSTSSDSSMEVSPSRRRKARPRPTKKHSPVSRSPSPLSGNSANGNRNVDLHNKPLSGYSTCSSLTEYRWSDSDESSKADIRLLDCGSGQPGPSRKRQKDSANSDSGDNSNKRNPKRARTTNPACQEPSTSATPHSSRILNRGNSHSTCEHQAPTTSLSVSSTTSHIMSWESTLTTHVVRCETCRKNVNQNRTTVRVLLHCNQQHPVPHNASAPGLHPNLRPHNANEIEFQSQEEIVLSVEDNRLVAALHRRN